jgi:hypothetical protein
MAVLKIGEKRCSGNLRAALPSIAIVLADDMSATL